MSVTNKEVWKEAQPGSESEPRHKCLGLAKKYNLHLVIIKLL